MYEGQYLAHSVPALSMRHTHKQSMQVCMDTDIIDGNTQLIYIRDIIFFWKFWNKKVQQSSIDSLYLIFVIQNFKAVFLFVRLLTTED